MKSRRKRIIKKVAGDETEFFACLQKKNHPRVTIKVCKKCKHIKTCSQYQDYIQPSLFDRDFSKKKAAK